MDEDAADRASESDRLFFERHSDRDHHVRLFVPGELPMHGIAGDGLWVIAVRRVRPSVRARLPLYVRYLPPDDEDVAAAAFRVALEGTAV